MSFEFRVSSFELRASSFELRASSFELRGSRFELKAPSPFCITSSAQRLITSLRINHLKLYLHKEKTTGFEQRATGRKYNLALFINVDVQLADAKSAAFKLLYFHAVNAELLDNK
jgi:hypothetical protein